MAGRSLRTLNGRPDLRVTVRQALSFTDAFSLSVLAADVDLGSCEVNEKRPKLYRTTSTRKQGTFTLA